MAVVSLTLYEPTARPGVYAPYQVRGRVEPGSASEIPFGDVEQPSASYVVQLAGWAQVRRGWLARWAGVLMRVAGVVPTPSGRITTAYGDETDETVRVVEPVLIGGAPVLIGGAPVLVERTDG